MSFYEQTFPFPNVAEVAGLRPDTAAKWVRRGHLVMRPEDRNCTAQGILRRLSARTTLQTVVAAELWRRGMSPGGACEAAICFAHEGQIAGQTPHATRNRAPGHLYPDGLTLLFPDREDPMRSRVQHFTGEEPIRTVRARLDAVDLETLFLLRLAGLGIDVPRAIHQMKGAGA